MVLLSLAHQVPHCLIKTVESSDNSMEVLPLVREHPTTDNLIITDALAFLGDLELGTTLRQQHAVQLLQMMVMIPISQL